MTLVAFAYWDDRIAPVFDTARQFWLVESGAEGKAIELDGAVRNVLTLSNQGVKTLVCGAISREMHEMLNAHGILVKGFVTGDLDDVVAAYYSGELDADRYAMPGCCGRRRQHQGGCQRLNLQKTKSINMRKEQL